MLVLFISIQDYSFGFNRLVIDHSRQLSAYRDDVLHDLLIGLGELSWNLSFSRGSVVDCWSRVSVHFFVQLVARQVNIVVVYHFWQDFSFSDKVFQDLLVGRGKFF